MMFRMLVGREPAIMWTTKKIHEEWLANKTSPTYVPPEKKVKAPHSVST